MFESKDIILCESYRWLCDYIYGAGFTQTNVVPPEGIVCVSLDEICDFFKLIEGRPEKYIVISPRSDYGLFYQEEYPVWTDLPKWLRMNLSSKLGYEGVYLAPRCDINMCNINHKYSIRMYAWTKATFQNVPNNVLHWLVANNGINNNPKIESIPFGVGGSKSEDQLRYKVDKSIERKHSLYVNFGLHTFERYELLQYYVYSKFDWVTIVQKEIPFEKYWHNIQSHTHVLCPNGNGIDCYRTLESIYGGAIPILEENVVTKQLHDLPIALTSNMFYNRKEDLPVVGSPKNFNYSKLSYWDKKLKDLRQFWRFNDSSNYDQPHAETIPKT